MPNLSTAVDDFNDGTLDATLWPNNYGTCSETGGRARTTCSIGYSGLTSDFIYTFDSFFMKVYPPTNSGTGVYAIVGVYSPTGGSGTEALFEFDVSAGVFYCRSRVSFVDGGASPITYNSTNHRWIRMAIVGADLVFSTSPDGSTWTTQRTVTAPTWITTKNDVALYTETHRDSGTTDFAEFDDLNTGVTPSTNASAGDAAATSAAQSPIAAIEALPAVAAGTAVAYSPAAEATNQSLFTSQTPSVTDASDGAPGITTSTTVRFARDGYVTGARFYATDTVSGVYTVALWRVDTSDTGGTGTLLASKTLSGSPTPSTWNSVSFDSPVAVTAETFYKTSVFSGDGRYVATNFFFNTDLVNGAITGDTSGDTLGALQISNGTFAVNSVLTYPSTTGSQASYFVDVVFSTSSATSASPSAGAATAASAANGATAATSVSATAATFTSAAHAATVSTSAQTSAPADLAAATSAASTASSAAGVNAGALALTSSAFAASAASEVNAGASAPTSSALTASVATSPSAGPAVAGSAAPDPVAATAALAGAGAATSAALAATISTVEQAQPDAGVASHGAVAYDAVAVAVDPFPTGAASAVTAAFDALIAAAFPATAASASVAAHDAVVVAFVGTAQAPAGNRITTETRPSVITTESRTVRALT